MDISAKTKEHPESVTVQYDMPTTLEGLTEKFGVEYVTAQAIGATVISLQAFVRRHIDKATDEIQNLVTNWDPSVRQPAVKQSAFERASSALKNLSAEERAELLAKLQG